MADPLGIDLRLRFGAAGEADLALGMDDLETVAARDNLVQALSLRLLIPRGELAPLGHPRYGSRVHELIGQPMDSANLELLRRYVRQALLEDQRVREVVTLTVRPRVDAPGVVEMEAVVTPVTGEQVRVEVSLDVG